MRQLAAGTITLLLLLMISTVLFAQTTVTFYDPNPAGSVYSEIRKELIAEFEEANPDIVIEHVNATSYADLDQKMLVAWAGGIPPNVVILEQSSWPAVVYQGMIEPLDGYIANDPSIELDDIYPGILEHVTLNDNVWGIPYQLSTPLLYFNKELFAVSGLEPTAPKTWDDILQYSRAIAKDTNNDGVNDVWGIDFPASTWLMEAWMGQNGARVANADGTRYTFDSDEAIEAMEFIQSLMVEHDVAGIGNRISEFWNNNLGMHEESTAAIIPYTNQAKENNIDLGAGPLACNVECYATIGGGNLFLLNTGTTAEKEAAWQFISFLSTPDNLARLAAATGFMAGRQSAFNSDYLTEFIYENPLALISYEQLNVAKPRVKVPTWNEGVASEMVGFLQRNWRGTNVREELTEIARRANAGLDEWFASQK